MHRTELASQSDMYLEAINGDGPELRWCIFSKGKRGPIAKIIVDTRPRKIQSDDYEPTAHIVNVHVRPEYRGKHLGEHLVRLAQVAMKTNGFIWMTLEAEENVEHHGKLVGLYKRCGFEVYPVIDHYPLEYNGDECFRKVPMRCHLTTICLEGPTTISPKQQPTTTSTAMSTITTTTIPSPEPTKEVASHLPTADDIFRSRFASALFVQEMKREAMTLLQTSPLNITVLMALDWIDQILAPGSMELAIRSGSLIRSRGHPDWMELAGYLRGVGRVQEKWTNWHAPFMVSVEEMASRGGLAAEPERQSDDEDEDGPLISPADRLVKSGPLPFELCDVSAMSVFIDPERYSQEGVDEALMMWSPNEFAFIALTMGDRCTAPKEMAQMIRYANCPAWLDTDAFAYLESFGDADVKQLALQYRDALKDVQGLDVLDATQIEEGRSRLFELVDKYATDVRML